MAPYRDHTAAIVQTQLVSISCGFVVQKIHNNPQQIKQVKCELSALLSSV